MSRTGHDLGGRLMKVGVVLAALGFGMFFTRLAIDLRKELGTDGRSEMEDGMVLIIR